MVVYIPLRLAAVGQYQQISCFARQRWTDRFGSLPAVSFASLPREHHLPFCDTRASSVGMYIHTCACAWCVIMNGWCVFQLLTRIHVHVWYTHIIYVHYINHRQIRRCPVHVCTCRFLFCSPPPPPECYTSSSCSNFALLRNEWP